MIKIAVASGKGGTGKTFVATNIFYTLLQNNYRAILVDCDAEAPNSITFFETKLIKKVMQILISAKKIKSLKKTNYESNIRKTSHGSG